VHAHVTRETINQVVAANGLEDGVDFLSIDIDGNDYWIWDALDGVTPRVVAIEYNALFGSERAVVVPYEPEFDRHRRAPGYFGASLGALDRLARSKGYRLVATEPRGANAYFVRADLAPSLPATSVRDAFNPIVRPDWEFDYAMPSRQSRRLETREADLYAYIDSDGLPLVSLDTPRTSER
jgi:hypothetical protein